MPLVVIDRPGTSAHELARKFAHSFGALGSGQTVTSRSPPHFLFSAFRDWPYRVDVAPLRLVRLAANNVRATAGRLRGGHRVLSVSV